MPLIKRRARDGGIIWAVRRVVAGERLYRSFGRGQEARQAAERYEAELVGREKENRLGLVPVHTLQEAIQAARDAILSRVRDSSAPTYRSRLKALVTEYGHLRLSAISRSFAADLQSRFLSKGLAPKTVNDMSMLASMVLNHAVDLGWLDINPMAGTRKLKTPDPFSTWRAIPEEVLKSIIDGIHPPWVRDAVIVLAHTGMRRGEVMGLNWEDIGRDTIRIKPEQATGKRVKAAGSTRVVPLPAPVRAVLEAHRAAGHAVPVGIATGERIAYQSLTNAWIRYMRETGQTYRLHDLRHTYACRLASAGVNPAAAQRVLGHTSIEVTMRYYRLTESEVLREVRRAIECHESATAPESNERFESFIEVSEVPAE